MILNYERHQADNEDGSGLPPIVLIHGLGGGPASWKPLIPLLLNHRDVITVDLPGFGGSPPPKDRWSLDFVAESIDETLDSIGVTRYTLVGHSLGGGVAIVLARFRAPAIESLGLISPAGFLGTGSGHAPVLSRLLQPLWRFAVRTISPLVLKVPSLRAKYFSRAFHDPTALTYEGAVSLANDVADSVCTPQARAEIFAVNLADDVCHLDMPTTIIWGDQDVVTNPAMGPRLERAITNSSFTRLPNVGHIPMWEATEATADALIAVLRSPVGSPQPTVG